MFQLWLLFLSLGYFLKKRFKKYEKYLKGHSILFFGTFHVFEFILQDHCCGHNGFLKHVFFNKTQLSLPVRTCNSTKMQIHSILVYSRVEWFLKKTGHMSCCSTLFWDPKSKNFLWSVAFSHGAWPHKASENP